jgi:hypothetical protein
VQPRGGYRYRLATGITRWFLIDLPTDADGRHRQHKRRGFPSHATAVQAKQHARDAYGRAELGRLARGQPELRVTMSRTGTWWQAIGRTVFVDRRATSRPGHGRW